jgi:two-component system heavy metal sensor histidine kinase CusS
LVAWLTLAFACTTLLLVGLGSAYLYYSLGQILTQEGEDDLEWEAAAAVRRLNESPNALHREFLTITANVWVRIFDASGQVVNQSTGIDEAVPLRTHPLQSTAGSWEEVKGAHGERIRIFYASYSAGHVQVIRNFNPEDRRLLRFRRTLFLTLGLTSVAAALVGFALARKGLAPLKHLADQAKNIHPEALSTRLQLEIVPLELRPLIEALNHSLSRLESAFQRLSTLNADMAHELRTPLHSLRLEAERILSLPDLSETTEDSLVGMMETLDHMGVMIGQMLFLARNEDPSTVIEPVELNALDLLMSVKEPFESLAEEKSLRIEVSAAADLHLRGDATLLRRAFHNLVDNAIRYAPVGSCVSLEARELPTGLALEVLDHGEGMSAEFQSSIGQRFIRPDRSRSRITGGTGLGLAIVQSIAKLHGAVLEIESHPAETTRIRLLFPRI